MSPLLPSRLAAADFPQEHWEHAHSPSVSDALKSVWPLVRRRAFLRAQARLAHVRSVPMSESQRLRLLYIDGLAAQRRGEYALSIELLDEARDLAVRLDAHDDLALLAAERARSCYGLQRYGDSITATEQGIGFLEDFPSSISLLPVPLPLELLHRWGICLGHADRRAESQTQLLAAYRLASSLSDRQSVVNKQAVALRRGLITWDLAFMAHIGGDLSLARSFAEEGLTYLDANAEPEAYARLQTLLATILLDQAAAFGAPSRIPARKDPLIEPASLIAQAEGRLVRASDSTGYAHALLAHVRLARLQGRSGTRYDSLAALRRVELIAHEFEADSLLGLFHTACARESLAIGDVEPAIWALRRAMGYFDSQPIAERAFTVRLLRRAEEMRESPELQ